MSNRPNSMGNKWTEGAVRNECQRLDAAFGIPIILGLMILALVGLASTGIRLQPFYLPLAIGSSLIFAAWVWRYPVTLVIMVAGALCGSLLMMFVSGKFWPWPYISLNPDAWSYGAVGSYLSDFPRGQITGMPLIDQWASHLRNTRFASATLIACISNFLGPQNIFYAHSAFYAICATNLFCSIKVLGRALGLTSYGQTFAAILSVLGGWTQNSIVVASYDNLLFLSLAPAVIALVLELQAGHISSASFFAYGSILAAALGCVYPEGLAIFIALAFPFVLYSGLWCIFASKRLLLFVGTSLMASVLCGKYLPLLIPLVRSQLASVHNGGIRSGEGYFPGMQGLRLLPSFFGLGSEYPERPFSIFLCMLPAISFFLVLYGAWTVGKKVVWYPWIALSLSVLLVWQVCFERYSYGAYKVVFAAEWWIIIAIVAGIDQICRGPRKAMYASLGMLSWILFAEVQREHLRIKRSDIDLASVSQLTEIEKIDRKKTIFVELSSEFDQLWALAFLKNEALVLAEPEGYLAMPHVQKYLGSGRPVDSSQTGYALRYGRSRYGVWTNGRYSLELAKEASILRIDNPNGVEQLDGEEFVWIGKSRSTTLNIRVRKAGTFLLTFDRAIIGPSGINNRSRSLEVIDYSGSRLITVNEETRSFSLKLTTGFNSILLRCDDQPSSRKIRVGDDPRELYLGLRGLGVLGLRESSD